MDALSRLLFLHPVRTALDTRCQFGEPWCMERAREDHGVAPYHLIVEGKARLDVDGHDPVELVRGDMLVLPRGHTHRLYNGSAICALPRVSFVGGENIARVINDGLGPVTDILCGQFHFGTATNNTLINALPDIVLVRTAGRQEFVGLQALVALLRAETTE